MKKLQENLTNSNKHYLYPFFWVHGESNEKIKEYIDKISEQGIHSFCVESRPHPDYLQDGWWENLDFIVKYAKEKEMNIWLLDDVKFPTGYANGQVPDNLKKKYLACSRFDVIGINSTFELDLTMLSGSREYIKNKKHKLDKLYKIILAENQTGEFHEFDETNLIDVTDCYDDGILYLNLKPKNYSIFVLYITKCQGEQETEDYLDPMRKEATQILLDEVYEKHYEHYKNEFGKTISGFFSDEPRFGNFKGSIASIGRVKMVLPWNENVIDELKQIESFEESDLLYLFFGDSEKSHRIRYEYMDIVSQLYSDNFSKVIGKWCEAKGITYTGHIIEDNNAHARLGYGAGHYFRSTSGQSIAGIDIIGGQIVPGMDYHHTSFGLDGSDGEFYHYALVKMGASAARLDPKKNGFLMCEAFGAYGWVEGLKMMKWITDHMISHGVNIIVPHAFSLKDFPDWDCPPHFYANGNNPQFEYFKYWSRYTDRLCHLMSNGKQVCKIGVLYHAFAEWSGEYMLMQKVLKELQQNQLDCNVISEDYLLEAQIGDGCYKINDYSFEVLVIPYSQRLPKHLLDKINELAKYIKIIFINDYPQNYQNSHVECVKLKELSNQLEYLKEIKLSKKEPLLVYYHYKHNDGDVFMLSNEDISNPVCAQVTLDYSQPLVVYDAYENKTFRFESEQKNGQNVFDINLEPYNSLILVSGESKDTGIEKGSLAHTLPKCSTIEMRSFDNLNNPYKFEIIDTTNLSKTFNRFSGIITYKYETQFSTRNLILSIDKVYETVEVLVNDTSCGVRICPPYDFDLSEVTNLEKNIIEIRVINTLARNQRDILSQSIPVDPLGIIGEIKLYRKKD